MGSIEGSKNLHYTFVTNEVHVSTAVIHRKCSFWGKYDANETLVKCDRDVNNALLDADVHSFNNHTPGENAKKVHYDTVQQVKEVLVEEFNEAVWWDTNYCHMHKHLHEYEK